MNKSYRKVAAIVLLATLLLGCWWLLRIRKARATPLSPRSASAKGVVHAGTRAGPPTAGSFPATNAVPAVRSPSAIGSVVAANSPSATVQPTASSTRIISLEQQTKMQRQRQVWDLALKSPITFYGQVVDIHGEPLAGAAVSISMVDSAGEHDSKFSKTTDAQGRFQVEGHGLGLVVQTSMAGYYTLEESGGSFSYAPAAGKLSIHSDLSSPATFILQKKGGAEPLVVTRGVLRVENDGTGQPVSLTTGKASSKGGQDLLVQAWVHDQGVSPNSPQTYDWQCRISVPGGGIQPREAGGFDFTAPKAGYRSSAEISMQAAAANWRRSASQSYFILLANGDYARMDFDIGAETPCQFKITAFLNPAPGHTNLEYDSEHAPKRHDWGALTGR